MRLELYRKEILLLYSSAILLFAIIYLVISDAEGWGIANRWLIQSIMVLIIVFFQTISRLNKNRLNENLPLYKSLGWGNRMTILRGVLIAILAGYLFQPWPTGYLIWMPGIIYMLAAIIDRVDGYLARITRMPSQLGAELDTVFDAIGLLIAPLLAVSYGQLHWSYLFASIAYYLFVLGIYTRKLRGLRVNKLPPNITRRTIAGFQMGFVAAVLLPVFHSPITQIAGIAFMLPLLVGFVIDWFIVRGSLTAGEGVLLLLDKLKKIGANTLLPILRILVTVLAVSLLLRFDALEIDISKYTFATILAGISILFILTGINGRIGAALLAIIMGLYYQDQALSYDATILLFGIVWIMMLGTGRYSLYKQDEDWVNRYDGS